MPCARAVPPCPSPCPPVPPVCPPVPPVCPARSDGSAPLWTPGPTRPRSPRCPNPKTSTGQGHRSPAHSQPVPGVTPAPQSPHTPAAPPRGQGCSGDTRAGWRWHQGCRCTAPPARPWLAPGQDEAEPVPASSCRRLCQAAGPQCHAGARLPGAGPAAGPEGGLWAPAEPLTPARSPPPASLIVRGTGSVKSV